MPADVPPAAVVIDAGGEPWSRVVPVLSDRVAHLPGGGLIDLVTDDAEVRAAATAWCGRRGYEVEEAAMTSGARGLRIRTGDPLPLPEDL
ncbi:hypothetical protein ETD86_14350 [Nonomuraea turkmeniaca]|uniref:Uncharacterized protein n=1 Tax=Nonomuraea turkmeniaca TaxID=103838 RepID=A0A5S4FNC4_9ACTN|nr:hypothetical protein [Nonomuraea turkmeniaca]TMR21721.1 hypothetical protein ETD86_14350 [Nonomuraea turkmeniaca]